MVLEQDYSRFDKFIVSEVKPSIAHVQINRPRSFNSFDKITWLQYELIFTKLDQDPLVKVIILSGSGKNFSSGLDVKAAIAEFGELGSAKTQMHEHIDAFQKLIGITTRISTPTIALIHGLSIGLALDILGAVTIRIVTKDAKLSVREIAVGLVADIGSLQRLPRVFNNQSKLNEYALTGEFWGWKDAAENGFVSHVVDDKQQGLQKCIDVTSKIVQHERWCIRGTKESISYINEIGVQKGLQNVADYNTENIDTAKLAQKMKRIMKL